MSQSLPENEGAVPEVETPSEAGWTCWRCGLEIAVGSETCPHCAARIAPNASPVEFASRKTAADGLGIVFLTYGLLLATGLVHAILMGFMAERHKAFDPQVRANAFTQILVVEAIDTTIVAATLLIFASRLSRATPVTHVRIAAWLVAVPLLGGMLLINLGYHAVLRELIHAPLLSDRLMQRFDLLAIVAICVQPAIVEEAYCRWFALDCLRGQLGTHAAVWISATMFGFLHVAVLPSVPYLILMGAFLAYMRLATGTIVLPMLLHFVHNFVILVLEGGF
jgi:membrane protease YdiL (CAAX protease family)